MSTAAATAHLLNTKQEANNLEINVSNGELLDRNPDHHDTKLDEVLSQDSSVEDSDADAEVADANLPFGPQFSLQEQLDLDKYVSVNSSIKEDASLRKWKEQLLGSIDVSNVRAISKEPEVKVLNLTVQSPGRPNDVVTTPFRSSTAKSTLFTLKEGCKQQIKFEFIVSKNFVCGLKYIGEVWKKGIKVDHSKKMVGTFGPREEPYKFELEEGSVPSGFFARGSYSARTRFVDDDGKCHFDATYYFDIQKNWAS